MRMGCNPDKQGNNRDGFVAVVEENGTAGMLLFAVV
jgi:hypothetical protein